MSHVEYVSEIAAPLAKVWAFYDSLDGLFAVTPPATKVRVLDPPSKLEAGSRFTLVISQPPIYFPLRWETVIVSREPPHRFVDEQGRRGPFAAWHHEHGFEALGDERTRLRDTITYTPPLGPLGIIADKLFIRRQLDQMFAFRHAETRRRLE